MEAQVTEKRVCKQELGRNMSEISHQLQGEIKDGDSDKLFNNIKTKIGQLQADIEIVREGHSQVGKIFSASASQESLKEHVMLHQQC